MTVARGEIAAAVLDGKIYVAGGLSGVRSLRSFEEFEPGRNEWRRLAPLPVRLHHIGMAAVRGRVYVTGGYCGLSFLLKAVPRIADTWAYDPTEDRWEVAPPMPGPRAAHTVAEIDGRLYVVGGLPEPTALWIYDPETGKWDRSAPPMPTPREHLTSAVIDSKCWVIGGRWGRHVGSTAVEVYDPVSRTWEAKPPLPTPRGGLSAAAVGGRLYVTGGEEINAVGIGRVVKETQVFDPQTGVWSSLDELPPATHGNASVALHDRWYVIGGATKAGLGTFHTTTSAVLAWTPGV